MIVNSLLKISVIIPVYNTQLYLEQCISSVLSQDYTNIEVICVNDGSTDRSGEILDHYATTDPRLKHISKKNEGVSITRQLGIDMAKGDYLFFVDSDDYIPTNAISTMVAEAEKHSADVVFSDCYYSYDGRNDYFSINPSNEKIETGMDYLKARLMFFMPTKLIRRTLIQPIFSSPVNFCEDAYALAQILPRCEKIVYIPKPLYYYRQNTTSLTLANRAKTVGEWMRHALAMYELLPSLNYPQTLIDKIICENVHTIFRYMKEGDTSRQSVYYNDMLQLVKKTYIQFPYLRANTAHRLKLLIFIVLANISVSLTMKIIGKKHI